jgi:hypothetical protein
MFWDIAINDWDDEKRQELLWFATGTKRAPLGGCIKMNPVFTICMENGKSPNAHTCFNQLHFPAYHTKEELREKIEFSMANTNGFG